MKKIIIIFLVVVARLAMVVEVRAISYDTSYNQGILKIHTQGAPHLTKSGQIVNNWTADSMFTRIVWNADAGRLIGLGEKAVRTGRTMVWEK